jgi:hypothetical protein
LYLRASEADVVVGEPDVDEVPGGLERPVGGDDVVEVSQELGQVRAWRLVVLLDLGQAGDGEFAVLGEGERKRIGRILSPAGGGTTRAC